jgi:uncharacterized membrane protein (UPF0127 family)
VQLAQTAEEQFKGLSGQVDLADNGGMLFIFENYGIRSFVMRKMNFPLDIVWIRDNTVVGCEKNIPVLDENGQFSQVGSFEPVNYVLELNAGMCDKYMITKGDKVSKQNDNVIPKQDRNVIPLLN